MRTADDVIKEWQVAVSGRTRAFPAIPLRDYEIMLAEVLRLRAALAAADALAEAVDLKLTLVVNSPHGSDIPSKWIVRLADIPEIAEAYTAYTATKGGE